MNTSPKSIRPEVQQYRALLTNHIREIQKAPKTVRNPLANAIAECRRFLSQADGDIEKLKVAIREGRLADQPVQSSLVDLIESKFFTRQLKIVERRRELLLKMVMAK